MISRRLSHDCVIMNFLLDPDRESIEENFSQTGSRIGFTGCLIPVGRTFEWR